MSEEIKNSEKASSIVHHQSSIDIRSDEVQEIMSHVPNWMIRWGISLIFALILLFLFLSWLIKYPDTIQGDVSLTTSEPPVKLVVKNAGEINQIYFDDKVLIHKGDVLISLNNTLSVTAKEFLEKESDSLKSLLKLSKIEDYLVKDTLLTFGTIQGDYSNLINAIKDYQYLVEYDNTAFKIANAKEQIGNYTILKSVTYQQLETSKKLFANAEEKYLADKTLLNKGILSKMQFFEEEKKYILAKNDIENYKKTAIQQSITITDLEKQLNELKFAFENKKSKLLQGISTSLSTIDNAIANWEMSYQIIAPIDGELSYLGNLNENKFIKQGEELFAIIPNNQEYIGYLKIPKSGFGKVKVGQEVRIKVDNFPSHEFGQLNGTVKSYSLIPNEDSYLVKVSLTKGMMSTYNKELLFTPEMTGSAEIITEDLRIIERIFNRFRKIFDN